MIEELKTFAFTCDAQREDICEFTTIVERTLGEKQAQQVAATRGWTINVLNEYCPKCWADIINPQPKLEIVERDADDD